MNLGFVELRKGNELLKNGCICFIIGIPMDI